MSLLNFILARVQGHTRSDHRKFMRHLTDAERDALCGRIGSLSRRGVLADWGYAVPDSEPTVINAETATELSLHNTPTSSIEGPLQLLGDSAESTNYVPVARVTFEDALPSLKSVPELNEEDDIVLSMGTSKENSSRPSIDSSPLYRTVCSIVAIKQFKFKQQYLGDMVMDGSTTCHGRSRAAGKTRAQP